MLKQTSLTFPSKNNQKLIKEGLQKFPKLKYKPLSAGRFMVYGDIDIFDVDNNYWDSFSIKIFLSGNYPYSVPIVQEVGGQIPREDRRHIDKDGYCCLDIDHALLADCRRGLDLEHFLIDYVYAFFSNQLFYEQTGYFANGEWRHFDAGIKEFYLNIPSIKSLDFAVLTLKYILSGNKQVRNKPCYCGSGIKLKKCHGSLVDYLTVYGMDRLKKDLQSLRK